MFREPYHKLAFAVFAKAAQDLGDKAERRQAYLFLTGTGAYYPIFAFWCELANIRPELISTEIKKFPVHQWGKRIRELKRIAECKGHQQRGS